MKSFRNIIMIFLLTIIVVSIYVYFLRTKYLAFSDAAKFAEVARNIANGEGFRTRFTFFGTRVFNYQNLENFPASGIFPAMPYAIYIFFSLFGINDTAVVLTSIFFFLLTIIIVYLLAQQLFGQLVGALSALTVLFNVNLLDYATSGGSESLFILEVITIPYLLIQKNKSTNYLAILISILMYFTRPQAFIFIYIYLLMFTILNFGYKKTLILSIIFALGSVLIDYFVLSHLHGKFYLYSIMGRGLKTLTAYSSSSAVSDALRGGEHHLQSLAALFSKVFYNLYNFYRNLPDILNPYLFTLFFIGLFQKHKKSEQTAFKIASSLILIFVFVLVSLSIPLYRYVHPVVPFVNILAVYSLKRIIESYSIKNKIRSINASDIITVVLIIFFVAGQTLGVIFLDSRFLSNQYNPNKPPVYVKLSEYLKENTASDDLVVTNLDTWGTWYGERKTVWFPLEVEQLVIPPKEDIPFDRIFLTSYLIDDQNYYMNNKWREILNHPHTHHNDLINTNFELTGEFLIDSSEVYENTDYKAVLLTRKIH